MTAFGLTTPLVGNTMTRILQMMEVGFRQARGPCRGAQLVRVEPGPGTTPVCLESCCSAGSTCSGSHAAP